MGSFGSATARHQIDRDDGVQRRLSRLVVVLGAIELPQVDALAKLAEHHQLVITHGGPPRIGYALERELRNRLPGMSVVAILTHVVVDADVPSPEPKEILELEAIELLADAGDVVISTGGGSVPVVRTGDGRLEKVKGTVDDDRAGELLAEQLAADVLLMLGEVHAVEVDGGRPHARTIHAATPAELRRHDFAASPLAPAIEAACRFVERTGGTAAIGALADAADVVSGCAGTLVRPDLY